MASYPQCITDESTITVTAAYPYYSDGSHHGGIDTKHPNDFLAFAPQAGTIVTAHTWQGGKTGNDSWGNYIVVDMGNKRYWLAAHFKAQTHKVGEVLKAGDLIGTQGQTGNATGIHTHWEYWFGGRSTRYRQDPSQILGIPNAVGKYDVTWSADNPPGPGPEPPTPGKKAIPVWLLLKMARRYT